jgi:hypothetical protein
MKRRRAGMLLIGIGAESAAPAAPARREAAERERLGVPAFAARGIDRDQLRRGLAVARWIVSAEAEGPHAH